MQLQVYAKFTWSNPLHADIFPDGECFPLLFKFLLCLWQLQNNVAGKLLSVGIFDFIHSKWIINNCMLFE